MTRTNPRTRLVVAAAVVVAAVATVNVTHASSAMQHPATAILCPPAC